MPSKLVCSQFSFFFLSFSFFLFLFFNFYGWTMIDKGDITRAYWRRKFIWYDVLWCQCLRTKGYKKGTHISNVTIFQEKISFQSIFWVTFNGTYLFFNIKDRKFYSNLILSVYVCETLSQKLDSWPSPFPRHTLQTLNQFSLCIFNLQLI